MSCQDTEQGQEPRAVTEIVEEICHQWAISLRKEKAQINESLAKSI